MQGLSRWLSLLLQPQSLLASTPPPPRPPPLPMVHLLTTEVLMHFRGQQSPATLLLTGRSKSNFMPTWASF